jgi:hypothetical protein
MIMKKVMFLSMLCASFLLTAGCTSDNDDWEDYGWTPDNNSQQANGSSYTLNLGSTTQTVTASSSISSSMGGGSMPGGGGGRPGGW